MHIVYNYNNNYNNNDNNLGDIFNADYIDGLLTSKKMITKQRAELRLSENVLIASQTTQYLKSFQLDAVRFLYERLSKQEFCILNDESGLGKCSAIVALLNGLGASKKTLIVLQNDDQLLAGWQFHLGVLTDLPVCVVKDFNDSTESAHSVYLSKWSVLRSIGDLSKLNFDYVIVDHRGFTLNNNFCTSMLIKQYERKVNIVISSVDLTSDVKLLYNVLRLGGCLEHQHKSFRSFEHKFPLPDVKEVLSKRVDLEDYYKQRGVLGEYIKNYRLRRYRHQFETYLPLVAPEEYKCNLSLWLGQNNSNSTIGGSTIESVSEEPSTAATDEIFECMMTLKQEELAKRQDAEKMSVSEHSDDVVDPMEPLVFEMSDSDDEEVVADVLETPVEASTTDVVLLSSDDCEIVTLPNTPPQMTPMATTSPISKSKRKYTKRLQTARPAELTESEAEEQPASSKKMVKKLNVRVSRVHMPQKDQELETAASSISPTKQVTKPTPSEQKTPVQAKNKTEPKPMQLSTDPQTPKHEKPSPITPKTEPRSKRLQKKNISPMFHPRQTRGMQRLTRSADSRPHSKYMVLNMSLDYDKKSSSKHKRSSDPNQTPKSSKRKNEKPAFKEEDAVTTNKTKSTPTEVEPSVKRPRGRPRNKKLSTPLPSSGNEPKKPVGRPPKKKVSKKSTSLQSNSPKTLTTVPAATQELLSSGSTLSDYSYMQCGQKLPENLAELASQEFPQFRVPLAPPATPLMLPSTFNLFSDSEVAVVSNASQQPDVVVINSSLDESSQQSVKQSQSRRTRALKRKRSAPPKEQSQPCTSSFGQMLAAQRATSNKSPDIFSNCSDVSQITLAQPVPFEGFKIFGSEVKQLQQQHAKTQQGTMAKKKRDRSCLDILEQMFEPDRNKNNEPGVQLLPNLPSPTRALPEPCFTLLDDDIFEITNNGEFGSRLRLTASGHVSPVQQQQRNKITNYLISSGGTPEDVGQRTQSSHALRKSPKSIKSTQSTKLTRWFGTAAAATAATTCSGESQSVPSTPVMPAEKIACARAARSGGAGKRKRLDLYK